MTKLIPPPTRQSSYAFLGLVLLTALAPAIWGTTYLVTTELLPAGYPMFAALMRSLPAGLIGLVLTRKLPVGSWWWKAGVLGVLNIGLFFPLLFVAADRLPGGVAATLGAAQPLIVAVLALIVLSQKLSFRQLGWGILGVAGVGFVVLGPKASFDAIGIIAGLAAASAMGAGIVLAKRWGRPPEVGALAFASWQLAAGGIVLLLPTMLFEGTPHQIDLPAVVGYFWLGIIGSLVAYTLFFRGLARLPVTSTALLGLLSPLVAAFLGLTLADETFSPIQLLGFTFALTALAAGQISERPKELAR